MKTEEKDMMNPLNWGAEEIKEVAASALLFGAGSLVAFLMIWLAYQSLNILKYYLRVCQKFMTPLSKTNKTLTQDNYG